MWKNVVFYIYKIYTWVGMLGFKGMNKNMCAVMKKGRAKSSVIALADSSMGCCCWSEEWKKKLAIKYDSKALWMGGIVNHAVTINGNSERGVLECLDFTFIAIDF